MSVVNKLTSDGSQSSTTTASKIKPLHQIEFGKTQTKISFSTSDKATRRVIAPFVRVIKKGQKIKALEKEENKHFTFYAERKPSVLMQALNDFLNDTVELTSLFHETTDVLKNITHATGVILYTVDSKVGEIVQTCRLQSGERQKASWKIDQAKTVAAFVALNKEYVLVDDVWEDIRFSDGVGWKGPTIKSVLCVPVVTPENECLAVIELYKDASLSPFTKDDLKITIVVIGWMGAAIDQNTIRLSLQKQQKLNDYLLNLVKCYFSDTMLENKLLTEMSKFAKHTLEAERSTFYILDKEGDEVMADVYEEGLEVTLEDSKMLMYKKKHKVSLASDTSIPGIVARSGKKLNILDAYNDPRFPKQYHAESANINRSVLCIPILGVSEVLGVIEVANKIGGPQFTSSDEVLLKTFAFYSSLVLYYSQLHHQMFTKDKINKIYSEMITFHMQPCPRDIDDFRYKQKVESFPSEFTTFDYYITPEYEDVMPQLCLHMIQQCVGFAHVDVDNMINLILTVKKSYRCSNPYHNFHHAFNVCHCMHLMLDENGDLFSLVEREALITAALTHDIDHQGWTNNFIRITNSPISDLYEHSSLENHHFYVTMKVLGRSDCFTNLDQSLFRELTNEIKHAILATDLAAHFRSRIKLMPIVADFKYDWHNSQHKRMIKELMMTASDLSGQCKPFPVSKKITDDLYKEFYYQGDAEKNLGITPLSMMDREKPHLIPEDQVQFLSVVVLPCVELLAAIIPKTISLVRRCRELRDNWKDVIGTRNKKVWMPAESFV